MINWPYILINYIKIHDGTNPNSSTKMFINLYKYIIEVETCNIILNQIFYS